MESRAFPAFTYDPYAGDNQAARFSLEDNPQPEADWPVAPFEYADETLQRVTEETPFTVADFVLCDTRYAAHFARVPRERWNAAMVPADEWLARDPKELATRFPTCSRSMPQDVLQRVIVDAQADADGRARAGRSGTGCRSRAASTTRTPTSCSRASGRSGSRRRRRSSRQLKATRRRRPPRLRPRVPRRRRRPPRQRRRPRGRARRAASAIPTKRGSRPSRCPSCNECQNINDKMFTLQREQAGVHQRRQAGHLPADGRGGRELPGLDHPSGQAAGIPNEPGLDELVARAEPFRWESRSPNVERGRHVPVR